MTKNEVEAKEPHFGALSASLLGLMGWRGWSETHNVDYLALSFMTVLALLYLGFEGLE